MAMHPIPAFREEELKHRERALRRRVERIRWTRVRRPSRERGTDDAS